MVMPSVSAVSWHCKSMRLSSPWPGCHQSLFFFGALTLCLFESHSHHFRIHGNFVGLRFVGFDRFCVVVSWVIFPTLSIVWWKTSRRKVWDHRQQDNKVAEKLPYMKDGHDSGMVLLSPPEIPVQHVACGILVQIIISTSGIQWIQIYIYTYIYIHIYIYIYIYIYIRGFVASDMFILHIASENTHVS